MNQTLLDEKTRETLKQQFQHMENPVLIEFVYNEENERNDFTRKFFSELMELSDKIKFKEWEAEEFKKEEVELINTPALFLGRDEGYRIEFVGTPAGYEAQTMIETIILISGKIDGFKENEMDLLNYVDRPLLLESFVTTSCPHCPKSSLLNTRFAIAFPRLFHSRTIEASENMELAKKYNVSSVPQQMINREMDSITLGARKEAVFIDSILRFGSSRYEQLKKEAEKRALKELVDAPDHVLNLKDSTFEAAKEKYSLLLVDFWAEWCGPCKMLTPIMKELAEDLHGKVVVAKINVDEESEIPRAFNVQSIPTVILFKNGEKVEEMMGAAPKEEIMKKIIPHFSED